MVIHKTVKTALVEAIRNEIVRGNFAPGVHLRLDNLAERFEVSTMPIREALRALEAEGLVYSVAHRGSFVTRFSPEELLDIYEMRAILEKLATRDAVPNIQASHIARLQDMVDEWHSGSSDIAIMVQQNMDFHTTIYNMSNRPHLFKEILILRNRTQHYIHAYVAELGRFEKAKQEHQAIVNALQQRDSVQAAHLMFMHIWHVGQALAEYVQKTDKKHKIIDS